VLHAVELDCDRRVLGRRPDIEIYGDTLLTVSARDFDPLVAAAAFAESEVPLHKRIVAMTTPPRTVSVLGVLTVLTLAVVLLIGSCEVPVPIALEPERGLVPERQNDILHISVDRDGSVYVNEEPYEMEDVSAVVAPLYAASEGALVISIVGDHEVPYQFMEQLRQELVASGPVFVVYEASDPLAPRSPPNDLAGLMEQGLPVVLPAQVPEGVEISIMNVLHLIVQPSGIVDVRRGAGSRVQQLWPREIEGLWRQEVGKTPDLIAAVKTHPDAPYRFMVEVLEALHSAKAERISLQVLED
jgi:biopolymer transport protein ExbD